MPEFCVAVVIDGDTFEVVNGWKWNGQSGSRVRPTGYDAPEINAIAGQQAKQKLARLIQGKLVNLTKAHAIDRGRLVCDVYYNGRNLADYFKKYGPVQLEQMEYNGLKRI